MSYKKHLLLTKSTHIYIIEWLLMWTNSLVMWNIHILIRSTVCTFGALKLMLDIDTNRPSDEIWKRRNTKRPITLLIINQQLTPFPRLLPIVHVSQPNYSIQPSTNVTRPKRKRTNTKKWNMLDGYNKHQCQEKSTMILVAAIIFISERRRIMCLWNTPEQIKTASEKYSLSQIRNW